MKRFLFLVFVLVSFSSVFSQTLKRQVVFTGGEGFSMTGLALRVAKDVINTENSKIVLNLTPVVVGSVDIGLDDLVSLGVSYTYQDFAFSYDRYTLDSGIVVTGKFTDHLTRQNLSLRPLFHFVGGNKVDAYLGLRVGYSKWTLSSSTNQDYATQKYFSNSGSCQGIFGIRYYPTKYFGLNAELGIGPNYVGMFGLNLRFGGKKE